MEQVLVDVRDSIHRFLFEAKKCARKQCGFAGMLTAFSVILGVSEAVSGRRGNDALLKWFVSQMDDQGSWILLPESEVFSVAVVGEKLAEIRDSLAHQFSLPFDVFLVNNRRKAQKASRHKRSAYIISTREFIDIVRETVDKIIEASPDVVFDSNPRGIDRGAASRQVATTGAPPLSGSST
jgi:hypothetical protein